ncbi:MAG TPA: class I SAM-dependent methyltransferase [Thermoanaerobaculia bacterium]|nr:class I SAM-dependent methyltransferase [Thermoanaerobaculia bacterium]
MRRRIGALVAGDPERGWSLEWFARRMRDALPFRDALSIGSGTGAAERHLVSLGAVESITAIDPSATAIGHAEKAAAEAGLAGRISHAVADAHSWLGNGRQWDAVFFHGSLHHLDRLPELFALLESALRPGGILFLDEYVGPSRGEWSWPRMIVPNLAYRALPRSVRRTRIVRAPVTDDDPTEMICASEIAPLVRRHFEVVEWRNYGGNLVSLVYPNLRKPAAGDAEAQRIFGRALERLFRMEDFLLRHPWLPAGKSLYAVVIARKR